MRQRDLGQQQFGAIVATQAFEFHIVTAYYVLSALYMVVPLVIWQMLSGFQLREATWWCGGGVLIGLGTFLIERTNPSSHFAAYTIVGPAIIFVGLQLKTQTLNLILSNKIRETQWITWTTLYVAVVLIIANTERLQDFRRMFYWSSHVAMYGHLTYLAWRLNNIKKSKSAHWIFIGYSLVVFLLLAIPLSNFAVTELMWREGWPAIFLVMTGILILFTNHIAFMGLILENSWSGERLAKEEALKTSQKNMLKNMLWVTEREKILANVSRKMVHEVNQSLTSLSATVSLLQRAEKDRRLNEINTQELLQRMARSIQSTTEVMKHVRPLAKDRSMNRTECRVADLIRDAIDISELPQLNIFIEANCDYRATIYVNRIEIIQVIVNMIKNAFQACAAAGIHAEITVSFGMQAGYANIEVSDNGPGLTLEAQAKAGKSIFTTKDDGMGIGLWICQEIIERHGGVMKLSNKDTRGASVSLTLPYSK